MLVTDNVLVSVVIPAYNMEKYLSNSIESVLRQTFKKLEIIVVDDASTDNTLKIAENFTDRGVVVYNLDKNYGVANALKIGFEIARGDYITFLSADDEYINPRKTEQQIFEMINNKADWSYYHDFFIGENSHHMRIYKPSFIPYFRFLDRCISKDYNLLFMSLLFQNPINSSTLMISRNCLDRGGNWDPRWKNADPDGDLLLRYCIQEMKPLLISGAPLLYRIHTNQLSNNVNNMSANFYSVRKNALNLIDKDRLRMLYKKFLPYYNLLRITGIIKQRLDIIKYLHEAMA
jgi:glycosyltransferase involved in cell wall biosynthesis